MPNVSAVESFHIDAVNFDLIPAATGATDLPGLFAGGATHFSGKAFYCILNQPNATGAFPPNTPYFLLFNSSNGTFTLPNVLPPMSEDGVSLTLDSQSRNVALATSSSVTIQELQSDGTLGPNNLSAPLSATAESMSFDTLGRILYLSFSDPNSPSGFQVHIYSPSSLQESANSPLPTSFPPTKSWSVDPTAPLIYADKVYQVDPQTGIPNEILPSSPVSVPVVFGLVPGSQPVFRPSFASQPHVAFVRPFTVTVTTSSPASAPLSLPVRFTRPPLAPVLPFAVLLLLLVFLLDCRGRSVRPAPGHRFALACISALAIFSVAACGGGSTAVARPPTVTPSGTYTVTINFSANSSSGQPLQLSPLQLTLKVN